MIKEIGTEGEDDDGEHHYNALPPADWNKNKDTELLWAYVPLIMSVGCAFGKEGICARFIPLCACRKRDVIQQRVSCCTT
eukprot:1830737-Amphidinium_carterae.1